jgi:hypothetical protein
MLQLHTIERRTRQILQFEARSTDRKKVLSCPWRIVISPSQMACNIVTSLFFRSLISKVLLVLTRHNHRREAEQPEPHGLNRMFLFVMPPRAHSNSAGRPAAPGAAPFAVLHGLLESAKGIAVRCLDFGNGMIPSRHFTLSVVAALKRLNT